jgi:hypothetical protein
MKIKTSMPEFNAELAIYEKSNYIFNLGYSSTNSNSKTNFKAVIPAQVVMPYCHKECGLEVCGSPLPGYPPPICWICKEKCDLHDPGPYVTTMR